ncbi:MAG TPA: DUF4263 domain-containing protein [Gallicola sp.]|nr:DUF4263 domain-containing protein [Gallicola sp.]
MIEFEIKQNKLILIYSPDGGVNFIFEELKSKGYINIKYPVFKFKKSHIFNSNNSIKEHEVEFILGNLIGNYFKIDSRVLGLKNDLFINKSLELKEKHFIAKRRKSIFKKIDDITNRNIYIGGNHKDAISEQDFNAIIKNFPNDYEINQYVKARLNSVLKEYIDLSDIHEENYNKYLNKKPSIKDNSLNEKFIKIDIVKYSEILNKLKMMLENSDQYNEKQWQEEILHIILLIFPKYIHVFKEVPVKDVYNKTRKLDFLLVDSSGYVDIIEIKKPFDSCIVSKNEYRGNHIPLRELSGAVMQLEKYIFYLNKWGGIGEKYLSSKYKNKLPNNFNIRITNPGGLIIMGRSNLLNKHQKEDFEVIRRKYKNVIDIMSYDDLIHRLENIIEKFKIDNK